MSGYIEAGYSVALGVVGVYALSVAVRRKRLQRTFDALVRGAAAIERDEGPRPR